jgi:Fe-S cluster assembly iron-binding protein IscA
MLAITEVAAIAIEEMLATRRMPREAGVRLSTEVDLVGGGDRGPAVVMDLALAPRDGDAILVEAPVFVEAEAAPALGQKLLDASVSTERVHFTLRDQP